jgi:hypothetical protein
MDLRRTYLQLVGSLLVGDSPLLDVRSKSLAPSVIGGSHI